MNEGFVQRYHNGHSGVVAYETGPDSIRVKFKHGGTYEYDYASTGQFHVERMKVLAASGQGLATFISKFVKANYARHETQTKSHPPPLGGARMRRAIGVAHTPRSSVATNAQNLPSARLDFADLLPPPRRSATCWPGPTYGHGAGLNWSSLSLAARPYQRSRLGAVHRKPQHKGGIAWTGRSLSCRPRDVWRVAAA